MNAMESLIRDLGTQIDALDEGNYGEVILDPPCRNSPRLSLDVRAFPEPDVYLGAAGRTAGDDASLGSPDQRLLHRNAKSGAGDPDREEH